MSKVNSNNYCIRLVNQFQSLILNSSIKNLHLTGALELKHLTFYGLFNRCYDTANQLRQILNY